VTSTGNSAPGDEDHDVHVDVHQAPSKRNPLVVYMLLFGMVVLLVLGTVIVWTVHEQGVAQTQIKRNAAAVKALANENAVKLQQQQRVSDARWCALIAFSLKTAHRQTGQTQAEFNEAMALTRRLGRQFGCGPEK
jgi:flagellar basal body-associated protein FliL